MDQSIMYRDPELEASFSFSGYDFINSFVFSDVEDGDNDDEYIEIALEKPSKHADYNDSDDGYDVDVDGLELRISFSSSVPFPELSSNKNNTGLSRTTTVESLGCESIETVTTPSSSTSSSTSTSTSTSTLSCSSSGTYWAAASATHQPSSNIKRKVQFRSVNRLRGSFLSIPRTPSEIVDKSDNNSPQHETTKQVAIHTNTNQLDLFQTRKSPKIPKTSGGGIMMKLLIKCRSINIRTLLASLVKPYQIIINAPFQGSATCGGQKKKKKRSSNNKSSSSPELVKSFEKWLVQRDKANSNDGEGTRVFETNMDATRGVMESMSAITSLGRRDKRIITRSSSPSTTSSNRCVTIRQGNPSESKMYATTTDNSIQAAIAHCKTSFGATL